MEKVYILECGGFYKIGFTGQKKVQDRVDSMKTGNPLPINILKVYECIKGEGRAKEKMLHNFFAHKSHQLEWFKLNKRDFIQIDRLMGIDIVEQELQKRKQLLENKINTLQKECNQLIDIKNNIVKYTLKDNENNHIKLENKKIYLKKNKLNSGVDVLSGNTRFASKDYFVNVYFNKDYYTLTFKRKVLPK